MYIMAYRSGSFLRCRRSRKPDLALECRCLLGGVSCKCLGTAPLISSPTVMGSRLGRRRLDRFDRTISRSPVTLPPRRAALHKVRKFGNRAEGASIMRHLLVRELLPIGRIGGEAIGAITYGRREAPDRLAVSRRGPPVRRRAAQLGGHADHRGASFGSLAGSGW